MKKATKSKNRKSFWEKYAANILILLCGISGAILFDWFWIKIIGADFLMHGTVRQVLMILLGLPMFAFIGVVAGILFLYFYICTSLEISKNIQNKIKKIKENR